MDVSVFLNSQTLTEVIQDLHCSSKKMLDVDFSLRTHLIDDPSTLNNPLCTDNHQVDFLQDIPVKKKRQRD